MISMISQNKSNSSLQRDESHAAERHIAGEDHDSFSVPTTDAVVASLPCRKRVREDLVANGERLTGVPSLKLVHYLVAMQQTFQA